MPLKLLVPLLVTALITPPSRAAEFGGVAARLDLDFFDEVDDHVLAREAGLQVGRLDAVDDEAVLAGAGAVDREAAQLGFLVGAGRLRHQRGEVAAVRQQLDLLGADVGLARALAHVDERRFRRDLSPSRSTPDERQREVDLLDLAEADAHVDHFTGHEALQVRGDLVGAGSAARGNGRRRPASVTVETTATDVGLGFDGGARKHGARGIPDDAFDRTALFLRQRREQRAQRSVTELRKVLRTSPFLLWKAKTTQQGRRQSR